MTVTMYDVTVPVLVRALENLSAVLKKGEAYATAKGIAESDFINAKLAEDMFPLSRQIQLASDSSKGAGARLSGTENPSYEDTESTFDELQERLAKTVSFLKSIDKQGFEGSETRSIELKAGPNVLKFAGKDYLTQFVLPNVFFHVTTAYAILRNRGVDLGKTDYLRGADAAQA